MSSILRTAQRELNRHSWEHFVDNPPSIAQGGKGVVVPGCPACNKVINTTNGFIEHLTDDVLPRILETAFSTATKFVYCRECKAVVEYEKSLLESEGRTGLEIVCSKCRSPICMFHDSKPAEAGQSESQKAPACPKCGMPLPCGIETFDAIDVLRCPECDALFERGQFVCYGAKSSRVSDN
jgi:uncharacterized C2H2 Zn-finger protein